MTTRVVRCEHCGRNNRIPAAASGVPRCGSCHRPLPWVVTAGDDTFGPVVEEATIPVVVDFWAPWCGPCRAVTPVLEQLAREMAGRVKLVKVNVDETPRLAERFSVQAVPTLLLMHHGKVRARQPGAPGAAALRRWLQDELAGVPAG